MSKREKKFNEKMQQSLLNLYAKGDITEYTFNVTKGSVRYEYVADKPAKKAE